jgi:hypothetical protein
MDRALLFCNIAATMRASNYFLLPGQSLHIYGQCAGNLKLALFHVMPSEERSSRPTAARIFVMSHDIVISGKWADATYCRRF